MNFKHEHESVLLSQVSSLCILFQIILSHGVANLLGRFHNFNICQSQVIFKVFCSSVLVRAMTPGAWNGEETWLVVEVCRACLCICMVILVLEYLSFLPAPFQGLTLLLLRAEKENRRTNISLLIVVAASLDNRRAIGHVTGVLTFSQRHRDNFWWVLWALPITWFCEVVTSFGYCQEVHNLLFLDLPTA